MKRWGFAIVKQDGSIYIERGWSPKHGKYLKGVQALRALEILIVDGKEEAKTFQIRAVRL